MHVFVTHSLTNNSTHGLLGCKIIQNVTFDTKQSAIVIDMNSDVGSFAVHFFHFTNNFYSLLSDNWSFIRSIDLLGKGKTI